MNELKDGYLLISVMEMTKKRQHLAEIQLKTIWRCSQCVNTSKYWLGCFCVSDKAGANWTKGNAIFNHLSECTLCFSSHLLYNVSDRISSIVDLFFQRRLVCFFFRQPIVMLTHIFVGKSILKQKKWCKKTHYYSSPFFSFVNFPWIERSRHGNFAEEMCSVH